ncbi:hypothetical protein PRZ48_008972 [Zasmidium cellare]|uniref:Uncharacterized protein n=1 Tax=Zasmidium cellare TaxID=395010 RepID=A0ABR0EHR4_ZASCE|nr:hypothetical protein PRZ48_008972 [Zasmidium cellare]
MPEAAKLHFSTSCFNIPPTVTHLESAQGIVTIKRIESTTKPIDPSVTTPDKAHKESEPRLEMETKKEMKPGKDSIGIYHSQRLTGDKAVPMLALLRAQQAKRNRGLPVELWLEIVNHTVAKDDPIPIWALPSHYSKLLAPFKNTNLEPHAEKTLWEKTAVRHTQSLIITSQGDEIKNLPAKLRGKIQHLQIDTNVMSLPRHLDDLAQTIQGCSNIKSLAVHLSVTSTKPLIRHAGVQMLSDAVHSLAAKKVKKTIVVLVDMPGTKPWSAKRLEEEVQKETIHKGRQWTEHGGIEVQMVIHGPKEALNFVLTPTTTEI